MDDNNNGLSTELFNRVWRNIVLFKSIFKHVRIYEENEFVVFNNRKELLEYPYRDYIGSIRFKGGELLEKGDLPNSGELKSITPSQYSIINGDVIPFGVKTVRFVVGDQSRPPKMTNLSKYPSSVTSVYCAYVGTRDSNICSENGSNEGCMIVPESITSLRTRGCTNVSGVDNGNGFLVFSNSIKTISLDRYWNNDGIKLRKGDFPEGLVKLFAPGYEIKNLSEGVLPSTLEHLELLFGEYHYMDEEGYYEGINDDINMNKEPGYFNVIPPNVKIFDFTTHCDILECSKLNTCILIKELSIIFLGIGLIIEPNSLPPNLTHLTIDKLDTIIKIGVIPSTVINAKIECYLEDVNDEFQVFQEGSIPSSVLSISLNKLITLPNILPNSLTELNYQNIEFDQFTTDQLTQMISILPSSLQSICLPESFKDKLIFPNTINNIEFNNYKF